MGELVKTRERDYLDEDKQIKNQNYCLLSFISPEDVIKNKESYYVTAFLDKFSKDMDTLFNGLKNVNPDNIELIDNIRKEHSYLFNIDDLDSQYKFSKSVNESDVERQYHNENDFQTSMRGIKVRGVFDTLDEAKMRSEFLKKQDPIHNIFTAQVGCWCPWSPNPDDLNNQEYSETQLNTLMKEYKKNQESKDEVFEQRKQDSMKTKLDDVTEDNDENSTEIETKMSELDTVFTEKDPWSQKQESKES